MSEDIFKEVQSIEGEADRLIKEAHKSCDAVRAELAEKIEEAGRKRQAEYASRKETVEAAGAVKLQADLDELRNTFETDRSRLERIREEQSGALSDWVVERFGEQR